MEEIKRIQELRRTLHLHNENYYLYNSPTISDQEFDQLMDELQKLEQKHPELYDPNSPTQRVGSDISQDFIQIPHKYPMLSLGNTYSKDDVKDFYNRIKDSLQGEHFDICCELKFDGLSISLIYQHGHLIHAITRGDGIKGDDVTQNVRTIKTIPLQLKDSINYPNYFEVRGEILMPWASFDKLNEKRAQQEEPLFANPRNAASGTLKSKSSSVVAKRNLDAYLYYLLEDSHQNNETHYDNLKKISQWGFKVSQHIKLASCLDDIFEFIDYWDEERKKLPVATDGIVLKVNKLSQQQKLGYTAKTPRWAIAYKFKAEKAKTKLENVTFQVGRTGAITPVAIMSPVLLAGTIVKRASLHNEDIIKKLNLHIGDYVYVEKAGEIIPQITGIDTSIPRAKNAEPISFISNCPECNTPLIRYPNEAAHYCPNDTGCPPQIKGRIEHFISRDAMNIESLGPETIEDYYDHGLIRTPADLYKIKLEDIAGSDRKKIISAKKIIESIEKSKHQTFDRVLYSLGIRFVGKVVAKTIAQEMNNIDTIQSATLDAFLSIDGIGNTIAQSILSWFNETRNQNLIKELKEIGLNMSMPQKEHLGNELLNKKIIISGTFNHFSREEYKNLIESHGGKNVSSISKNTSLLLAGDNIGPSKLDKAKKLGIPIISENDFLEMIHFKDNSITKSPSNNLSLF